MVTEVPLLRIVSVTAQIVVQATFRKIDTFLPGTGKKLGRKIREKDVVPLVVDVDVV